MLAEPFFARIRQILARVLAARKVVPAHQLLRVHVLECLWPRQLTRYFTSAKEARLWAAQRHIVVSRVPDCDS